MEGTIEVTGRRRRFRKRLQDDIRETEGTLNWKKRH